MISRKALGEKCHDGDLLSGSRLSPQWIQASLGSGAFQMELLKRMLLLSGKREGGRISGGRLTCDE